MKKKQGILFNGEERLSPRDIKEQFGIQIPQKDRKRWYTLKEIEGLLEDPKLRVKEKQAYNKSRGLCAGCSLDGKKVSSIGDFSTAKVVFVSGAPGINELEVGKLFQKKLKEVGINKDEVVFANVVRCRPPKNRKPRQGEMTKCKKYLLEELKNFEGLIVLLGAIPLKAFLNKKGILNSKGYGFMKDGRHYFVTYHPSYVLRHAGNKTIEKNFIGDLKKVKTWMDGIKYVPFTYVDNWKLLEKFKEEAKAAKYISFDLETNGLDPYAKEAKILSIAFSWGRKKNENWIIPLGHPSSPFKMKVAVVLNDIGHIFNDDEKFTMGQSAGFDIKWIKIHSKVEVTNLWFDTKFAAFLIDGKWLPKNLKSMVWKYTDYGGYGIDATNLEEEDMKALAVYNVMDAFCTRELVFVFLGRMSNEQCGLMTKIMAPAISALAEMEIEGLTVDRNKLKKMTKKYFGEVVKLESKLRSYKEMVEYEKNNEPINLKSPSQLSVAYNIFGVEPEKRTKITKAVSTDEEALKQVQNKHPFFKDMLEYRTVHKVWSTYLHPYGKKKTEAIRTSYNATSAITGRLTSSKPNLQNIPYLVRPVFMSKHLNDYLLEVDYSQLELRILGIYARDEILLEAFRTGKDIHEVTRFEIYGDSSGLSDATKVKQRVEAKTVNFGIAYGISKYGLMRKLGLTEQRAEETIEVFFETYKGVGKFITFVKEFVKENGYYETKFGRTRNFDFNSTALKMLSGKARRKKMAAMYREAVNFPIQSTARDLVFDAEGRLWKQMRKKKMDSRMIADVHDSILFDVRERELEELLILIKITMEDFRHIPWIDIPIKVDLKIGDHWGKLEDFEI